MPKKKPLQWLEDRVHYAVWQYDVGRYHTAIEVLTEVTQYIKSLIPEEV